MTAIVLATGLAGFGVSVALLALGVASMPIRYTVAVLAAYAVFLLLVRLWALYQRHRLEAHGSLADFVPVPDHAATDHAATDVGTSVGGGGRFGGGGAGRSWEGEAVAPDVAPVTSGVPALDLDLDEGWVLVVPVVVLVGGVLAAVYVIYAAPVLLAEVLLDVVLVSGLYRRLRRLESRSWLTTAIRRTWVPVALVVLLVAAGGFVIQHVVPQADSIGDVLGAGR